MTEERTLQAPLFAWKGLFLSALVALVLCWPMWLTGSVYVSEDTGSYIRAGQEIWDILLSLLPAGTPEANGTAGTGADAPIADRLQADDEPRFGRSIAYSAFVYPVISFFGPLGLAMAQGMLVVFACLALLDRAALRSRVVLLVGLLALVVLSSLPWRSVYLMPDILGAVIVVFALALTGPFDRLSTWQKITLTLLAAFATATHYGNVPLAAGLLLFVLAGRLVLARLTGAAIVGSLVVVMVAPVTNLAASAVILEKPTATPLRLPILLARSLRDGPAAAYLAEACPEENWTMCAAFGDDVPTSISAFLWDEDGIRSLSAETVDRIRDEEYALLWQVFLTYPLEQSWSLGRNTALQMVRVGQGQMQAYDNMAAYGADGPRAPADVLRSFDPIVEWFTLLSAAALISLLAFARPSAQQVSLVAVLTLALLANAAIFGGLSAPVDRYQARLSWLIPALLILIVAQLTARSRAGRAPELENIGVS